MHQSSTEIQNLHRFACAQAEIKRQTQLAKAAIKHNVTLHYTIVDMKKYIQDLHKQIYLLKLRAKDQHIQLH